MLTQAWYTEFGPTARPVCAGLSHPCASPPSRRKLGLPQAGCSPSCASSSRPHPPPSCTGHDGGDDTRPPPAPATTANEPSHPHYEVSLEYFEDVDFLRAVVYPKVQYPARPLKTKTSKTPVPVPASLIEQCSIQIAAYGWHETLLTGEDDRQLSTWAIERAMRKARSEVKGLPAGFRYHDLRHYFASLLIADGADVKTVQARLRHASAKTTLDTYGHIWPDRDESTRVTVDAVLTAYQTEQRRNSATAEP